ncbi:MAG: Gfo/Idh/MocA family oxidoreductase [Anaerolineae bacterium]|nr:Gfo/Idh/MocA family oxidoreductase [Anaerolineae bacterium]
MATLATGPTVRVAMIGAGNMANQVHYPSLASFPDVEFAGICDLRLDRLNTTGDKYGIERRYTDYKAMIEEVAPDAVYVIGPPDVMYPHWVWCLEQGLNLYIEKPMGITLHQARNLAYLAEKHGCITQVSFQRRICPMVVRLREECLKRGPIVHAVCRFYKNLIVPHLDARDHMMDDGVHAIDTLRWVCGGEVGPVVRERRHDRGRVRHANSGRQRRVLHLRRLPGQKPGIHRLPAFGTAACLQLRRRGENDGGSGEDPGAGAAGGMTQLPQLRSSPT